MAIIEQKPLSEVAPIKPADFIGMTLVILVQCQCVGEDMIALTNGQAASCPSCGTIYAVDRLAWDRATQVPKVALSMQPVSLISAVKH